jgi:6-phosphogluconolactonase (cycloisomerase 2 family)
MFAVSAVGHARAEDRHAAHAGVIFSESNEVAGNHVLVFSAAVSGELTSAGAFATGGTGTGDSLGSQGALALTEDRRFLLAVDAGSNDIASFAVDGDRLDLVDRVSSGGARPISVTTRSGLVYVVNATGNNVSGFYLSGRGKLEPISGATRPLSAANAGPGQVELSEDGRKLVVTEKTTSVIDVFDVSAFGRLSAPSVVTSAGKTPFGFEFTQRGDLVVSEASGSLSSYDFSRHDGLDVISAAVSDTQAAPCWVAISADDRFAYTANANSASISSYAIARGGQLQLTAARAGELTGSGAPLDLAIGRGGRMLFVLDRGNTSITGFSIESDGTLARSASASGLPAFTTGLVAD